MDTERLSRVRAGMAEAGLDALLCRLPENVLLLSGHWPLIGWSFLFFPLEGTPVCIVPDCDANEAKAELRDIECRTFSFGVLASGNPFESIAGHLKEIAAGCKADKVGIESGFEAIAPPWNAAEPAVPAKYTKQLLSEVFGEKKLVDATGLLQSQRACKTAHEAEKLRIANEISAFGLEIFQTLAAPGISGVELAAEVERAVMVEGTGYKDVSRVRAFAQVATGAEETAIGYRPMEISSCRKLESGDIVLLELAVVADGFWSDRTRVRVAGTANTRQLEIFNVVKEAQTAAIAKAASGITAGEVDDAARTIIRNAGFEKEFLHVTGHGIGLCYHEPTPLICPGSDLVLQPGMVHSIEPGIYFPEFGGMRIEDDVLITESGCEVLGPYKKELQ